MCFAQVRVAATVAAVIVFDSAETTVAGVVLVTCVAGTVHAVAAVVWDVVGKGVVVVVGSTDVEG